MNAIIYICKNVFVYTSTKRIACIYIRETICRTSEELQ